MPWQKKWRWKAEEDGFSVLELLAALPLIWVIGFGMLNMFGMGVRYYQDFLGDWELMQQVRIPMEEIAQDVRRLPLAVVKLTLLCLLLIMVWMLRL